MAAQYPGAAGTDANLFVAVNNLSTSLTDNPLSSGATTVNVVSTTGFPTAGYITIEAEAIKYTGTTGTSFTGCTRGADGTSAASHVTASQVLHDVVAAHHNVLKDEIKAIESDLIAKGLAASTFLGIGRNRIVNGGCDFDQNNEGSAYTAGTSAHYTLDQWRCEATGTPKFTIARSTDAPTGFQHSILFTTSVNGTPSAGDGCNIEQSVEGVFARDFNYGTASAVTLTLSFWAKASITGVYSISFLNSAANRAYVSTYTVNSANTWEYKTVTFVGDTTGTWITGIADWGMKVVWDAGSGSNVTTSTLNTWGGTAWKATGSVSLVANAGATLKISGAQLEIGSAATPFEYRLYTTELALCQRYFYKTLPIGTPFLSGQGGTGAPGYIASLPSTTVGGGVYITFPVTMAGIPTISTFSTINGGGNPNWWNTTQGAPSGVPSHASEGPNGFLLKNPQLSTDNGGDVMNIHISASSQIGGA